MQRNETETSISEDQMALPKKQKPSRPARRTCPRCEGTYPLTENWWHRNKYRKDGYARECKLCSNARQSETRLKPLWLQEENRPNRYNFGKFEVSCIQEQVHRADYISSMTKAVV